MKVRIKLRFNKLTGEVEEFLVEDRDLPYLPEAEHNRKHDRVATDIGHVLERYPRVTEVMPDGSRPVSPATPETSQTPLPQPERRR